MASAISESWLSSSLIRLISLKDRPPLLSTLYRSWPGDEAEVASAGPFTAALTAASPIFERASAGKPGVPSTG